MVRRRLRRGEPPDPRAPARGPRPARSGARLRAGALPDPRDAAADRLPGRRARARSPRAWTSYLDLLARDGVISEDLRARRAAAPLERRRASAARADRAIERKPAGPVRARLVELLGLAAIRSSTRSTCASRARSTAPRSSARPSQLRELRDPRRAAAAGLTGFRLLAPGRGRRRRLQLLALRARARREPPPRADRQLDRAPST